MFSKSTMDHLRREPRASAQARIAASAPKMTYGKYSNRLLPLTGSQFVRNDVFAATETRDSLATSNSNFQHAHFIPSDAEDSPLSDAELYVREPISTSRTQASVRSSREPGASQSPLPNISHSLPTKSNPVPPESGHSRGTQSKKLRKSVQQPAELKRKLKSTAHARSRFPLNELVLVPGTDQRDGSTKCSKRPSAAIARDPISSSTQPLLDFVDSSDSDASPAKRRAKAPLSAIRKRLRTPSLGYKSIERLRKHHKAAEITSAGSQSRQIIGDGFEVSELTPCRPSQFATKNMRKQRGPLIAGLQALTLGSGPLPEVVFLDETSSTQLKLGDRPDSPAPIFDAPAVETASANETTKPSRRQVSFNDCIEKDIKAQLLSVSAPRRERNSSAESEDDGGDELGDESEAEDDEDDEDDEAADTYLDDEPASEPNPSDYGLAMQVDSSEASPEPMSPASDDYLHYPNPSSPEEQEASVEAVSQWSRDTSTNREPKVTPRPWKRNFDEHHALSIANGLHDAEPDGTSRGAEITLDFRKNVPGSYRRSLSGKRPLNEVNERIDDDFHVDDMLLHNDSDDGSVHLVETRFNELRSKAAKIERPNTTLAQTHVRFNNTSSLQPRSILKNTNSTPYISSESNRPESTAANTRRNSMIDVEESRYFSAAKDQLDSTPPRATIIKKKSSDARKYYAPIDVPYSDDMVPETTPDQPDYTNGIQLHMLKRTSEAMWTSNAAIGPQRDLSSLTRTVSKDNGTLSQSIRRRSSLPFQSPLIGR